TRFSRDWSSDVCSSDLVYRYKIIIGMITFVLLTIVIIKSSYKKSCLTVENNKMNIQVVDSVNNPMPDIDIIIYEIEKSLFRELRSEEHTSELQSRENLV